VEYAITFFISFCTKPIVAAKNAVDAPIKVIIDNTHGTYSNIGEHFIIKNTPAVTIVAACINAETGVGPSIASGNHVCNPICADFPIAPINSSVQMTSNNGSSLFNIITFSSANSGATANTTSKFKLWKFTYINAIPIVKAKSAIRFITNAFIAALFACIRVDQKLINKYEHNPTPSHPKNNIKKLSPSTNTFIQHVNNDKYEINLGICGSCAI
jgi:hypothetical protein